MTFPKLFACMILRNEEHNLERCLSSIVDLCDRIVVVDTGSTDKTVEIARKYGAIVYPSLQMSYRKPPVWDFSFARNQSLQYCQDLGADWAFIIDGDEELQPMEASPEEFKKKLLYLQEDVHALCTQVHERRNGAFALSWWGTRFFDLKKGVFYEGIVHNRPKLINGKAASTDIVLYHYGYSDEKVLSAKRHRTLTLLDKRLAEDAEDYVAYYYRCLSLMGEERIDEAIEAGIRCLEIVGPKINYDHGKLSYMGALYYAIGWGYLRKWRDTGDQDFATLAYQWWITGWEKWQDDIDLNFWLCQMGYMSRNDDMVKDHGGRYLKAMEKFRQEVEPKVDKFVNAFSMHDMAIGARHIHMATDKAEACVKLWLKEAA